MKKWWLLGGLLVIVALVVYWPRPLASTSALNEGQKGRRIRPFMRQEVSSRETHVDEQVSSDAKVDHALSYRYVKISKQQLTHIANVHPQLRSLELTNCEVLDHHLAELAVLENLETLKIDGNPITDAGLKHIANLRQLKELSVARTKVSNKGLRQLKHLNRLRLLVLPMACSDNSDPNLVAFQRAVPKCEVLFPIDVAQIPLDLTNTADLDG